MKIPFQSKDFSSWTMTLKKLKNIFNTFKRRWSSTIKTRRKQIWATRLTIQELTTKETKRKRMRTRVNKASQGSWEANLTVKKTSWTIIYRDTTKKTSSLRSYPTCKVPKSRLQTDTTNDTFPPHTTSKTNGTRMLLPRSIPKSKNTLKPTMRKRTKSWRRFMGIGRWAAII